MKSNATPQLCRSCSAPIYWLRHSRTGRLAPIDANPPPPPPLTEAKPNITIDLLHEIYTVVPPGTGHLLNHFSTCPNASSHHKGARSK